MVDIEDCVIEYSAVKKAKRKNWLVVITVVLLLGTLVLLFYRTRQGLGLGVCEYEGADYYEGQLIPNYGEVGMDCYCNWDGDIDCRETELKMSYDGFVNDDLVFTYEFKNFLEKGDPNLRNIVLVDVDRSGGDVRLSIEKEELCDEQGNPPSQTALYQREDNGLVITTVTSRDELTYTRSCIITNELTFSNLGVQDSETFTIMYQNEMGQLFDLTACFFEKKLYAPNETFKDSKGRICNCDGPEVSCLE